MIHSSAPKNAFVLILFSDDPITSPAAQVPVPGAVPTPGATQALKPLPSQPGPQPPKSSQGMDSSHFMQQQSQIFVFSTEWANKASEAVLNGQYKSIISYHMDQPGTKNMLQVQKCSSLM